MNWKFRMVIGGGLMLLLPLFPAMEAQAANDTFSNPVAPMGHDPRVIQHEGVYYYCYADQNKLWVNSSADLTKAVQFEGRAVWTPPEDTFYSKQLWAPELFFIDGAWYIYVAASNGENENHRMYVLRSETPDGSFEMMGKIATPDDKWAIDGTVLEAGGQRFFIWSGWEGDENIPHNTVERLGNEKPGCNPSIGHRRGNLNLAFPSPPILCCRNPVAQLGESQLGSRMCRSYVPRHPAA